MMAANASTDATTTNINKQVGRQQDNTRMAFAASVAPTTIPTPIRMPELAFSNLPQQKRQPEQCNAKILQALLGIVAQPQVEKQMDETNQEEGHWQQQQAHMELSQIELIYRAEGNANLVLVLPQFKKVLRLPKTPTTTTMPSTSNSHSSSCKTKYNKMEIGNTQQEKQYQQNQRQQDEQQHAAELKACEAEGQYLEQQQTQEWQLQHKQLQQQKQHEMVQSASDPAVNQNAKDLTMEDFVAYIEIIRNLVGNEYIFETEIARIANEEDRRWINEQIRTHRPAHRRDKEFCGEFGLLLPDATRLPIAFDILLSNLQMELIGDTYAIEIKPKQGWLLPSDIIKDLLDQKIPTQANIKPVTKVYTTEAEMKEEAITTTKESKAIKKPDGHIARCRYCAMQFLKLRAGKINRRSSYCPIALFSGCRSKMLAAIDALLQCPQNNLRIFRNGILIYDNDKRHTYKDLIENIFPGDQIELLKDLLVACLLKDYTSNNNSNKDSSSESNSSSSSSINGDDIHEVEGIAKNVAGQPHLSSIPFRRAQKHERIMTEEKRVECKESNAMPTNRVESAHTTMAIADAAVQAIWDDTVTTSTTTKTTARMAAEKQKKILQAQITEVEMLCLPKNCVLEKVLHLQLLAKKHMAALQAAGYDRKTENSYYDLRALLERESHKRPLEMESLKPFEAYLLGATAMDCSIILAFQEISMCNQEAAHLQSKYLTNSPLFKYCVNMPRYNKTFLTKVTLIDLDPKRDSHLCKYIKNTSETLNLFMESCT